MHEQLNLDLQPKQPTEKPKTLKERYQDLVGVPARVDTNDVAMLAAIADPEMEIARLKEIDDKDNKDDIKRTYQRKH